MKSFVDKEVLVTGAGSGIGREMARAFAQEGARLWVSDINEAGNQETAEMIRAAGGTARAVTCDVADPDTVAAMADRIHGQVPALDILANNAGIGSAGAFIDTSIDTWHKVMDVNLMGVVHGCKAFLPSMVERGKGGHVINTASSAAYVAWPEMSVYAASKYAVLGFSESLRAEMAPHRIGVTTVCPGVIDTPIVANTILEGEMGEGDKHAKAMAFYKKRNYSPARVAAAIVKGVRRNAAVLPVSPEAWGQYYGKRFAPALMRHFTERGLPF